MTDYIHGGTDPREVARLEKQAGFAAPFILRRFDAQPGEAVLDLATGVGAMAGQLLARFPGIVLFGVDLNLAQLRMAQAKGLPVGLAQADATRLPFRDASFNRIHCSWLLEHVREPLPILREARRVLKPRGTCQFIEVDNATLRLEPEQPEVTAMMDALNLAQQRAGGDPFVGRQLGRLFEEAGFDAVEVEPVSLRGSAADPVFFRELVEEFAEIFESLDEALATLAPQLHQAAGALRALPELPGATMFYQSVIARGRR